MPTLLSNTKSANQYWFSRYSLLAITMIFLLSSYTIRAPIVPSEGSTLSVRQGIVNDSLSFLNPNILEEINKGVDYVESPISGIEKFSSQHHFNNCGFLYSTQNINFLYDRIMADLQPGTFGVILRAAMDFYAHTSWVELDRNDLVDDGYGFWTLLSPLKMIKGILIVQGEDINFPEQIQLSRTERDIIVKAPYGTYRGLISGVIAQEHDDCPNSIELKSWDFLTSEGVNENGVLFEQKQDIAKELAAAQVVHEWCRLINLTRENSGKAGAQLLVENWVLDKDIASSVCSS